MLSDPPDAPDGDELDGPDSDVSVERRDESLLLPDPSDDEPSLPEASVVRRFDPLPASLSVVDPEEFDASVERRPDESPPVSVLDGADSLPPEPPSVELVSDVLLSVARLEDDSLASFDEEPVDEEPVDKESVGPVERRSVEPPDDSPDAPPSDESPPLDESGARLLDASESLSPLDDSPSPEFVFDSSPVRR